MNDPDGLPDAGVPQPLDPRYITLRRRSAGLSSLAWAAVLGGAAMAAFRLLGVPAVLTFAVAAVALLTLVARGLLWPVLSFRHASYTVDAWGVEVRGGVLWRSVVAVPASRVQHTDVSQGPLERALGLGTLVLHTAGTSHTVVKVTGLAYGRALAIRDFLVRAQGGDAV